MYKVYDGQCDRYMFGEQIFETKDEAIEQLIEYFSVDHDEEDLKSIEADYRNGSEYAELYIEESFYFNQHSFDDIRQTAQEYAETPKKYENQRFDDGYLQAIEDVKYQCLISRD